MRQPGISYALAVNVSHSNKTEAELIMESFEDSSLGLALEAIHARLGNLVDANLPEHKEVKPLVEGLRQKWMNKWVARPAGAIDAISSIEILSWRYQPAIGSSEKCFMEINLIVVRGDKNDLIQLKRDTKG